MRIEFFIFAEPFSINKAYYLKSFGNKSASKIRTKECREWGDKVMSQLIPIKGIMKDFNECFKIETDAVRIDLIHYIPKAKFYTKAGHISIASCDITNIEKLLVDLLFDERFNGRIADGMEVTNFNINDKFIVDMRSQKLPSKRDYKIKIVVEIIPQPEISE